MGTWGNQCTLLVCAILLLAAEVFVWFTFLGKYKSLFYYLNVNKLISFQSFAVVYPYDNIFISGIFVKCVLRTWCGGGETRGES